MAAPPVILFGEKGLILVTYLGDINGKWKGPVTCHQYDFRREQRQTFVDRRDVEHLLKVENAKGEKLFTTESAFYG